MIPFLLPYKINGYFVTLTMQCPEQCHADVDMIDVIMRKLH